MKVAASLALLLVLVCSASEAGSLVPVPHDCDPVLRELAQLEQELSVLQRENQVKRVAFSTSLTATGVVTLGPFPKLTTLVFKHVVTNIGNAYNPHTGVFTAPVRGVYHFEWYIGAHGRTTGAVLVKNSSHIFMAYEQPRAHFGTSSEGVALSLEAGDVVFLRLVAGTQIHDNSNHHSTFSGHMLFTM